MMASLRDFYKNKKVLITGHTGFKGSWLSLWLSEIGAEVIGFSLDPPTSPSHFEICGLKKRMVPIRGDIRDLGALRRVVSDYAPEVVFHLAAQALVRRSYRDPVDTFGTNVMGTVNLLEACRAHWTAGTGRARRARQIEEGTWPWPSAPPSSSRPRGTC